MATATKRTWKHNGETKTAWVVRYVDRGGKQKQETFDKKKEADARRSEIEIDLASNRHRATAQTMTIGTAADSFLRRMEERAKTGQIGETHRKRVVISLRIHVLPYLAKVRLCDVRLPMLEEWYAEMKAARSLAPRTAIYAVQALKMVFDHALKRDWVVHNPVMGLLSELRGMRKTEVRTFTIEEAKALLRASTMPMYQGRTPDGNARLQCAVNLGLFCGLRMGEIFGLKKENIDFQARVIRIRTSLSRLDGLKVPKSASGVRDVAMPEHVVALLTNWLTKHQVIGPKNPEGLLFTRRDGRPFNVDGFRASWGALLVRAGLATNYLKPTFHFHATRHFAASWMIENGWSLPEVAGALGHAKVDVTLSIYAHALKKQGADPRKMQAISDRLMLPSPDAKYTTTPISIEQALNMGQ